MDECKPLVKGGGGGGRAPLLPETRGRLVGRCRLTVSKPVLKAPMITALDTAI